MTDGPIVVIGGGDLGTGTAHRLHRSGYRVVVLEIEAPSVVRRSVSFAQAVIDGDTVVEGIPARRSTVDDVLGATENGEWPGWVPVVVDPGGESLAALGARAVVDARMAKRNLGTTRDDAPVTIGLGPGFAAGRDVDYVVETMRGHALGRVITAGRAIADTGIPAVVAGVGEDRVIRAPAAGRFEAASAIGETVSAGDVVGSVGGVEVRARASGLLRGLIADGTSLRPGQKLGDVDPRGAQIDHTLISDKARAVAGAVLECLLTSGVLPERVGAGDSARRPVLDGANGSAPREQS